MDNAQKAIMIGVGLFITIIIISAVLLIVNLGTGLVDDATAELDTMSTSMQKNLTASFDNKTLSGSQVLNAINKYADSPSICIVLCAKETTASGTVKTIVARTGAKYVPAFTNVGAIGKARITYASTASLTDFNGTTTNTGSVTGSITAPRTNLSAFSNVSSIAGVYVNKSIMYNSSLIEDPNSGAIVGIAFQPVFA